MRVAKSVINLLNILQVSKPQLTFHFLTAEYLNLCYYVIHHIDGINQLRSLIEHSDLRDAFLRVIFSLKPHLLLSRSSDLPTIGASGAIAAVLGAYLVLYPRARVVTLEPVFYFARIVQLPAVLYLGFWFVSQLFNGA